MMAQQGKKVLLIGCDPKSDTTSAPVRRHAPARPSSKPPPRRNSPARQVAIGDVCFKRDGVYAMELGGPEVGPRLRRTRHHPRFRTAGEAGLPRMGLRLRPARLPRRRGLRRLRPADRPRHVPEGHRRRLSNDLQSLYVANNVCSAVEYFRKLGGNVGVGGLVINKRRRHRRGGEAFAAERGHPGALASIPADDDIRKQERELRDHRPARLRLGPDVRRAGRERRQLHADAAQADDAGPAARPVLGRQRGPQRRASSRPRSSTCAARPRSGKRPSKWSTTTSERAAP